MRTRRLPGFEYAGFFHYSLTMCTFRRRPHFTRVEAVDCARGTFCEEAVAHGLVIPAYCFMPDHVHLVISGRSENADLVRFGKRSRQRIAFQLRQEAGVLFWQDGYYDHILRDHERLGRTIRYVVDNPVRAGLAVRWDLYPFTGSQLGSLRHVLEWLDEHGAPDEDALLGLEG